MDLNGMHAKLDVVRAALDFAKADHEYVSLIHKLVHTGNDAERTVPSAEQLEALLHLRSNRDETEARLYKLWVGDGWTP